MMWVDVVLMSAMFVFGSPSSVSVDRNCTMKDGRLSCRIRGGGARSGSARGSGNVSRAGKRRHGRAIRSKKNDTPVKDDHPLSVGKPWRGRLRNAARLAPEGPGYVVAPRTLKRQRNYGTAEMVALVRHVASYVRRRYPRSTLVVGDMSARRGGRVLGHRSHQSGRDVDLGFFMVDRRLKPAVLLDAFVPVDSFGRSMEPHPGLRFDIERNWAVVEALLTNPIVEVKLVFVSHEVKDMLLKYARAIGVPRELYRKADRVLHYFPNHGDHFHVRIECPRNQPLCIP